MRRQEDDVVYAPAFDESLGEAIAGAVPVPRRVPLIVTDGDHLLVEEGPWLMIGFLLDVVWRVELDLPAAHDGRPPMRRAQGRADRVVRLVPRPR